MIVRDGRVSLCDKVVVIDLMCVVGLDEGVLWVVRVCMVVMLS